MKTDDDEVPLIIAPNNIDIEFVAVTYFEMPETIVGLEIHQLDVVPDRLQQFINSQYSKVFCLRSNTNDYYVIAGGFQIGTSTWLTENRMWNPDLEYDEIVATS